MEFYDFVPAYDVARQRNASLSPDEFFRMAERQVLQQPGSAQQRGIELTRHRAERGWLQLGRPYFKIWPGVIPLFANIGLDVPPTYLRAPFPAFVLRLPKTDNPLILDERHHIRSIMVVDGESQDGQRVVMLWKDIGETYGGWPSLHWSRLICRADQTIEEAVQGKAMPGLPGLRVSDSLNDLCWRLAVSVCFLSTGTDRLVEPDVLSKDFAAYCRARREGDERRVKSIENRAVRRGKKGWNVGKYERLRPLHTRPTSPVDGSTERGELTHQHQRRAHFRLLATGKVVFVRQATVRPDLPPPALAPGYGVK